MSASSETIKTIVDSAIAAINEELPERERVRPTGETPLIGPASALSSLQIVNLVIRLEEEIADRLGVELDLTVNEELFDKDGPLRTVDTLISYLSQAVAVGDE